MFSQSGISANTGPVGQQLILSSGYWTCPAGVTSVCAVCIGHGASNGQDSDYGGGGGGLGWKNNIPVVPGQTYWVNVGISGSSNTSVSYFISIATVSGGGGLATSGGSYTGDGGGVGGAANTGGGGAGGYTGPGGTGGVYLYHATSADTKIAGTAGQGGGGGGGGGNYAQVISGTSTYEGSGGQPGGGTGVMGQGANGAGGTSYTPTANGANGAVPGSPGSGTPAYGGGAGGAYFVTDPGNGGADYYGPLSDGQAGAVRLIWGPGRAFPSTMTGDL